MVGLIRRANTQSCKALLKSSRLSFFFSLSSRGFNTTEVAIWTFGIESVLLLLPNPPSPVLKRVYLPDTSIAVSASLSPPLSNPGRGENHGETEDQRPRPHHHYDVLLQIPQPTQRRARTRHLGPQRRRHPPQHHLPRMEPGRRSPSRTRLPTRIQAGIQPLEHFLRLLRRPRPAPQLRHNAILRDGIRRDSGDDVGVVGSDGRDPGRGGEYGGAVLVDADVGGIVLCFGGVGAGRMGTLRGVDYRVVELVGADYGGTVGELWHGGYGSRFGEYSEPGVCSHAVSDVPADGVLDVGSWGYGVVAYAVDREG